MTLHLGKRYIIRVVDYVTAHQYFEEVRIAELSGDFARIEYLSGARVWVKAKKLNVQQCIDCEEAA